MKGSLTLRQFGAKSQESNHSTLAHDVGSLLRESRTWE